MENIIIWALMTYIVSTTIGLVIVILYTKMMAKYAKFTTKMLDRMIEDLTEDDEAQA